MPTVLDYPGVSRVQTESPVSHTGHQISWTIRMKVHKRHFSDIFWSIFGMLREHFGNLMHFCGFIWLSSTLNNFCLGSKKVKLVISWILIFFPVGISEFLF